MNYRKLVAGSWKLLLCALAVVPIAFAQSGTFEILLNGKPVGDATCNFTAGAQGYNSTSTVHVSMPGLDYSLSKTEKLSSSDELESVLLSGVVNREAVSIVATPDSNQVVLDISANGRKTVSRLAAHPGAVLLPDFDPGAFETLLALAVERNNRGVWAILPRKEGSIEPVELVTYADEQGTLDGKSIAVHHLVAAIAGTKTDIFSSPENRLLQAELPQQGFALVRNGFVLKPPARAGAPPAR
ncbi:MAG: hypothetical protein ACRD25_04770 [Terracidiphilus sp.]